MRQMMCHCFVRTSTPKLEVPYPAMRLKICRISANLKCSSVDCTARLTIVTEVLKILGLSQQLKMDLDKFKRHPNVERHPSSKQQPYPKAAHLSSGEARWTSSSSTMRHRASRTHFLTRQPLERVAIRALACARCPAGHMSSQNSMTSSVPPPSRS